MVRYKRTYQKRVKPLRVYVSPGEEVRIKVLAKSYNLTISAFLRALVCGYELGLTRKQLAAEKTALIDDAA